VDAFDHSSARTDGVVGGYSLGGTQASLCVRRDTSLAFLCSFASSKGHIPYHDGEMEKDFQVV